MSDFSILIGGKAGDGIRQASQLIAQFFNQLGYWIFGYEEYPSLITGGHNFSIVRISEKRIIAHQEKIDLLIAFNKETFIKHQKKLKKKGLVIYDASLFKINKGLALPLSQIIKENNLPPIVRNTIILGFLAGIFGQDFQIVERIIKKKIEKKLIENLKVAKIGFELAKKIDFKLKIEKLNQRPKEILTGNEAIGLGAVKSGLKIYFAYPMTPVTNILHFLASYQDKFKIKVIQPENEIAVALMAIGASYAGEKSMVATSGGGFALMVESLSLAGQAEVPIVFVYGQRPAPATGIPTYTSQNDLSFVISAGHGEFLRIVLAPGDADEAFYLTNEAFNLAWHYQTPVIILVDKHLCESTYSVSFDERKIKVKPIKTISDKNYQRYKITLSGISPLSFPGSNSIVKANSYEHDEFGITTEEAIWRKKMVEKRLRKRETLTKELKNKETIKVYGPKKSKIALITWGSTKGVVSEVGEKLNLKVIQPLFLEPLPFEKIKKELIGVKKIIDIELNRNGQLANLLSQNKIFVDKKILKYDGRPFTVDELTKEIKKII
jgi:2-oxoglutarate ferredoxin oxidoreductase subunit alpha